MNPDFASSIYDVAIQETGTTGVPAALSNFDAQLQTSFTWDRTDRPQNVSPAGEQFFSRVLTRDNINYQTEISKQTASGTQMAFRNITTYDSTNRPLRELFSEWFTSFEFEARQPFLRGAGEAVNRIPIILARINTDVAIADFEIQVRNFVLEVERTYWNLYFYYQNLEAARTGFNSAQATWKQTTTRREQGLDSGEAANEAQSRAQYYLFRSRLEQAQSELFHAESQLRYMMGLTATDHRLIQPTDKPTKARVEFDFESIKQEAFARSPELRRQKWRIKQLQLQLNAAKNNLLPQLDGVALYRVLGLGDDLLRFGSRSGRNFAQVDSYAWDDLTEGRFGEWQLGVQGQVRLGLRSELATVRNQQLQLRRAEKRLEELENELIHQLSAAMRRLRDNYQIAQTQFNTLVAYQDQVESTEAAYKYAESVPLDLLLDAQARKAQSEVDYFRALTEYNMAIVEVHLRKGSLLEFNGVMLQEGPWPSKAYFDAETRARQRDASHVLHYGVTRPSVVGRGPVEPHVPTKVIREPLLTEASLGLGPAETLNPVPAQFDGATNGAMRTNSSVWGDNFGGLSE